MGTKENQVNQSHAHLDGDRSSGEIKDNIETTRSRMDRTLDLLGDKVDPKGMWDGLLDIFRGDDDGQKQGGNPARRTAQAIARPIKENPLAAIGLGASAIWLIAGSGDEEEDERYQIEDDSFNYDRYDFGNENPDEDGEGIGEKLSNATSAAQEKLGNAGEAVSSKLSDMGDAISDKAAAVKRSAGESMDSAKARFAEGVEGMKQSARDSMNTARARSRKLGRRGSRAYDDVAGRLGDFTENTKERYQKGLDENPLGLLIGALGIGLLAGVAAPVSRREERLYGEYSDEITDQLKDTGEELLEKGKRIGTRAAEVALDEVEESSVDTDGLSKVVDEVKSTVTDAAVRVKDEAAEAVQDEGLTKKQLEEKAGHSKSNKSRTSN